MSNDPEQMVGYFLERLELEPPSLLLLSSHSLEDGSGVVTSASMVATVAGSQDLQSISCYLR